jgi:hypothetical protein
MIEGTMVAVSSDAHSQFSKPNRLSVELVAGVEVKGNAALWRLVRKGVVLDGVVLRPTQ